MRTPTSRQERKRPKTSWSSNGCVRVFDLNILPRHSCIPRHSDIAKSLTIPRHSYRSSLPENRTLGLLIRRALSYKRLFHSVRQFMPTSTMHHHTKHERHRHQSPSLLLTGVLSLLLQRSKASFHFRFLDPSFCQLVASRTNLIFLAGFTETRGNARHSVDTQRQT
jgi:hypothetical protein